MSVITPAAFDSITLQERFVSVHGCRIRYLSAGSGPPLVFIHGLLGYAFSWRFNLPVLALVSPVNPWSRQGAGRAAFLGSAIGSALLRCAGPALRRTHSYFLRRMYGDPRRIAGGTLEGYDCALRPGGTLEHMLSRVRRWSSDLDEVERLLPAIAHIPTLLIWGSKDRAVPLASAPPLMSKLNHAELAVIEGAGHLPYEEVPQPFNELVLRFLLS